MNNTVPKAIAVSHAVDNVIRRDRGRLLAGLISRLGDFQLAEDALQEALIAALKNWSQNGLPNDPVAWLMKVGLNKGIDHIRSNQRESGKLHDLGAVSKGFTEEETFDAIPDERLRLIFTCCHPALEEKTRIALTLRTVCNLTTHEIAAAFLDSEKAMGQRLSRAKSKIKQKGIAFSVPDRELWPDRLDTVLSTLYLIFTTGYVTEDEGSRDLCREGIFLARLLRHLRPDEPEIEGALALLLLTDARRPARIDSDGVMVPIETQDRALWQSDTIREGRDILARVLEQNKPGPFQIKAAIADCHMMQPNPDWPQISLLYQSLWAFEPTPIVALNWAVVIAETGHANVALQKLEELKQELGDYQPLYAARAHVLQKLDQRTEARTAYEQAIRSAPNAASRKFLERKLQSIMD